MSETIKDVIGDIRAQNQGLPEDGYALSPYVHDLLRLADRIEAAINEGSNIKKGSTCYCHSIVLSVSNHNGQISHYMFRTKRDAMEVLNILSDYTGFPITTTNDIDYRVGDRIELINYPF